MRELCGVIRKKANRCGDTTPKRLFVCLDGKTFSEIPKAWINVGRDDDGVKGWIAMGSFHWESDDDCGNNGFEQFEIHLA